MVFQATAANTDIKNTLESKTSSTIMGAGVKTQDRWKQRPIGIARQLQNKGPVPPISHTRNKQHTLRIHGASQSSLSLLWRIMRMNNTHRGVNSTFSSIHGLLQRFVGIFRSSARFNAHAFDVSRLDGPHSSIEIALFIFPLSLIFFFFCWLRLRLTSSPLLYLALTYREAFRNIVSHAERFCVWKKNTVFFFSLSFTTITYNFERKYLVCKIKSSNVVYPG